MEQLRQRNRCDDGDGCDTRLPLTAAQHADLAEFRQFADNALVPYAHSFDREERIPDALFAELGRQGYLGAVVPEAEGGRDLGTISFGLLSGELGRGCSSVRTLITVHSMVAGALRRWGNDEQRRCWLPQLVDGTALAAFALSESNAGSDARGIECDARREAAGYVLVGKKRWVSFGQVAKLFLVFARCDGKPTAFLVEREAPGLSTASVSGLLGTRGAMVADLHLDGVRIPKAGRLAPEGWGLSAVAGWALDLGRYSVAWGCAGIIQACLDATVRHAQQRHQGGKQLMDHQLIQRMIAQIVVDLEVSRLLCYNAGRLKEERDPAAISATVVAKYYAARGAMNASDHAVRIHGAYGCVADAAPQRLFRDAKVMELIEGSSEINEMWIARSAFDAKGRA